MSAAQHPGEEEDSPHRRRRKFVAGALEQAAHLLGSIAASVFVAGLIGPYIAALSGMSRATPGAFSSVATLALAIALVAGVAAMGLRGLARSLDDDPREEPVDMDVV